jgi:hypothetical protein
MTFVKLGWQDTIMLLVSMASAYLLALPLGWERKQKS